MINARRFTSLAILAVAVGACARPDNVTSPDGNQHLSTKNTINFESASAPGWSTSQTRSVPTPTTRSGSTFFGSFTNEAVTYNTGASGSSVSIAFDIYVLGSWDGRGKQAQHGMFGENYFQLALTCAGSSDVFDVFTTSFSNQKTVQQNFPRSIYDGGGSPAFTGAYAVGSLGFTSADFNVPLFRSEADSEYHIERNVTSPCGSSDIIVIFRGSPDNWQTASDEAWGIDNVAVVVN